MEIIKKYGFQITLGIIVVLILINLANLNQTYTQFKAFNHYAKLNKIYMNENKDNLKNIEDQLKDLKQQKKELEKEYDESVSHAEKSEKEQASFSVTKEKLLQEKEQLLLKNDAYYTYDVVGELTEDTMHEAVQIATGKAIDKEKFTIKMDEDTPSLGAMFNDEHRYILFAYDRLMIVYEVNDKEEIQKTSIVDVEEKKIKVEESYKNLPIS